LLKEWLRDIAPVTKEFSKQRASQFQRHITVIYIACRDFDFQQFSRVIDDQVQLEPIKPPTLVFSRTATLLLLYATQYDGYGIH
jgi:hypothetical protein